MATVQSIFDDIRRMLRDEVLYWHAAATKASAEGNWDACKAALQKQEDALNRLQRVIGG